MKLVNNLLTHFDVEKGEFTQIELEKVSMIVEVPTFS